MCGICGLVSLDGAAPSTRASSHAMNETLVHRGPDSAGSFAEGSVGARRAAAVDHRPRGRRPAGRQRGRPHPGRPERRDLQLRRAARAAGARRAHGSRRTATPRCWCTCTRSAGRRSSRSCAACSRSRCGTGSSGAWCWRGTGSGSSRSTTASTDGDAVVRLGAEGAAAPAGLLARDRPRRARGLPRLQLDPGAADDLPRGAQAAARPPAARASAASRGCAATRGRARSAAGRERAESEQELARRAARAAARLGARAPRRRRAGGRAAVGRDRLVGARGAGGARERLPGQHVLDRVRGALVQRARAGAAGRRAVRHRPPRAGRAPGRGRPAAAARGGVRRAVRRLVRAAHLSRLRSSPRARSRWRSPGEGGDELFGGYYTYVADTLAPRIGARRVRAAPAGRARCPAPPAEGQLRLQGQALRARGAPAAARAPPRLEGDLLVRSARRAARRPPRRASTRSTSTAPATPRPRAPTSSPGSRTSTSASTCADDLLVKTDRASMAHSLEARVPFCDQVVAELALALPRRMKVRGALEEAAAAPGRLDAAAARDIARARKQGFSIPAAAWLRGDLRAVRPRRARRRTASAPGLLRPGGGHRA